MRNALRLFGLILMLACGGAGGTLTAPTTPPAAKKLDPYITILIRSLLDTTTAVGRADWDFYIMLTGPNPGLNGVMHQGAIGIIDRRYGHNIRCVFVGEDSVGQRLISVVGFADTTTEALLPDSVFAAIALAWYNGNHIMPSGFKALVLPPVDAWTSAQFSAGHGLVSADPIKWGWDLSGVGTTTFYEISDNICAT